MAENETRGILTDADKEWLRGETEYTHRQTESDRRRAIRERVSLAIEDFNYLVEFLSREDREKIAARVDQEDAEAMVALLYLLLNERAQDAERLLSPDVDPAEQLLRFRRALTEGIQRGKSRMGTSPGVVNLDSNTELHEVPKVAEIRSAMDTDQWREANEFNQTHASSMKEYLRDVDPETIDDVEAAKEYRITLLAKIEQELHLRRQKARSEIRRHDRQPPSTGLL